MRGDMEHITSAGPTVLVADDFQGVDSEGERRGEPRWSLDRPIVVMPVGFSSGLQFKSARMADCSRHGVAVLVSEPLPLGSQFLVKANLSQSVLIVYTVKNCLRCGAGWRVGGRLTRIIGPPGDREPALVLEALLQDPSPP